MNGLLIVITAPSGAGKSTLIAEALKADDALRLSVSYTTRAPRPGEVNGVHYHFFAPEEFDARIAAGAFLEWAWVHKKNRYGTLASSVLEPLAAGRSLVMNVDVQGVDNFRRAAAADPVLARHLATVFINVPIPELCVRLGGRGETVTEIAHRMQTAERELLEIAKFDHVIESCDRDRDFAALLAIYRQVQARVSSIP
jgi:guanylate kinase